MAVELNDRLSGPFACSGGETILDYDFKIRSAAEIAVWRLRGGGVARLVYGVDFTLTGIGLTAGTVVLTEAANENDLYVVEGDVAASRTTDLVQQNGWKATTLNGEWDYLVTLLQEIKRDQARALKRSRFDAVNSDPLELPPIETGKRIGIDSAGNLDLFDPSASDGNGGGGGGDPLAVADGGTGADNEGDARDNLGLGALAVRDDVDAAHLATAAVTTGKVAAKAITADKLADGAVAIVVEAYTTTVPPGLPQDGKAWIIPAGASGAWTSRTNQIAVGLSGNWSFVTPLKAWRAISLAERRTLAHDGSTWQVIATDMLAGRTVTAINVQRAGGGLTRGVVLSGKYLAICGDGAAQKNCAANSRDTNFLEIIPFENPPAGIAKYVAGNGIHFVIDDQGWLHSAGDGANGALGHGNTTSLLKLKRIAALYDAGIHIRDVVVSKPGGHDLPLVIAITTTDTAWAWGRGDSGERGDGTTTTTTSTPSQVLNNATGTALTNIDTISFGSYPHTVAARRKDGTFARWGYNGFGQLGDGTTTLANKALVHATLTGIAEVVAVSGSNTGASYGGNIIVRTTGGLLHGAGRNTEGQLAQGAGDLVSKSSFTAISHTETFKRIIGGDGYLATFAGITATDKAVFWGRDAHSQCGGNATADRPVIFQPSGGWQGSVTDIVLVGGADVQTSFVMAGGVIYAAGYNGNNNACDGVGASNVVNFTPIVGLDPNAIIAEWGISGAYALYGPTVRTTDGRCFSGGAGAQGELGWQVTAGHSPVMQEMRVPGQRGNAGSDGLPGQTGAGYGGSSTTSLSIPDVTSGTAVRSLTTQTGLAYQAGAWAQISSSVSGEVGTHWMFARVDAYDISTGVLDVTVVQSDGVGATRASWNINIAGSLTPQAEALAAAAAASASSATGSASAAAISAIAAAASASGAATSATNSANSATAAAASASGAATSATNAAASATAAAASASGAATSATNSANSATAAAASASGAATSATNSANSATAAAGSASSASTNATNAANSAAAASSSAATALVSANAIGPLRIYATKAAADAALAGLTNGDVVEVLVDESLANARTRYQKTAGVYVYILTMDSFEPVASRTALKALSTTYANAFLGEGNRWGSYKYRPDIPADTARADARPALTNSASFTATGTIAAWDTTVSVSCASANVTLTVPSIIGQAGKFIEILRTDNTNHTLTVSSPTGGQTVQGVTANMLRSNTALRLTTDGVGIWAVPLEEHQYVSPNLSSAGAWERTTLSGREKRAINRALNERPFESWPQYLHRDDTGTSARRRADYGKPYNLNSTSEDLSDAHYSKTSATVGTDTINYRGITLTRVALSNYFSGSVRDARAADYALTTGKRYIASAYVAAPFDGADWFGLADGPRRFCWMWAPASSGTAGHGAKLIGSIPRRIWCQVTALSSSTYDVMASATTALGSGSSGNLYWFNHSGGLGGTILGSDIFLGGMQLEEAPNQTEKVGIAVIGTSIETSTSSMLMTTNERSWPRYLEGLLNVPIFNGAIGGQSSTTLEARFNTDVAPWGVNAKYCILACNVNDFASGFSAATYRSNWASMYAKAITAGMIPIMMTPQRRSTYDYAAGPNDLQTEIDYIKATYSMVIDRDECMADAISAGLINESYDTDGIHQNLLGSRALAFMIAHKYRDFFQFDNVPRPYKKTNYDDSKVADIDGFMWPEGWESSSFDAATASINLRDNLAARAPVLIFTGAPGSSKTFQLTTPYTHNATKPGNVAKLWTIWNQCSDGFTQNFAIYDYPDGVTLTLLGTIAVPAGSIIQVITDGVNVGALATQMRARGDIGGLANFITVSGTSDVTANSTGVGSIKFKGATSRDSSGFVKIYIGTTAYYVPVFSAITG